MAYACFQSRPHMLTVAPAYSSCGTAYAHSSPTSLSPCESDYTRGGPVGFVSHMESKGHWQTGSEPRSPLSQFGFFKSLTEKKTRGWHIYLASWPPLTHSDGQAPKRRGPKPDSKPALTRRQELNRQAQR